MVIQGQSGNSKNVFDPQLTTPGCTALAPEYIHEMVCLSGWTVGRWCEILCWPVGVNQLLAGTLVDNTWKMLLFSLYCCVE